jgi:hypothetical protein
VARYAGLDEDTTRRALENLVRRGMVTMRIPGEVGRRFRNEVGH